MFVSYVVVAKFLFMNNTILIGLNVVEVAHNIQQQVSGYVKGLGLVNSFDTWHGMKYL